jgi:hypothetical protein
MTMHEPQSILAPPASARVHAEARRAAGAPTCVGIRIRRFCAVAVATSLVVLAGPTTGWSRPARQVCVSVSPDKIRRAVQNWADKLKSAWENKNPAIIVSTYAPGNKEAVLLPTCQKEPAVGEPAITAYFKVFLTNEPVATIDLSSQQIRIYDCGTAVAAGLYAFKLKDESKLDARYTYVFRPGAGGTWRIVHHHSSLQPLTDSKCPAHH